jgi:hypothetical protein
VEVQRGPTPTLPLIVLSLPRTFRYDWLTSLRKSVTCEGVGRSERTRAGRAMRVFTDPLLMSSGR